MDCEFLVQMFFFSPRVLFFIAFWAFTSSKALILSVEHSIYFSLWLPGFYPRMFSKVLPPSYFICIGCFPGFTFITLWFPFTDLLSCSHCLLNHMPFLSCFNFFYFYVTPVTHLGNMRTWLPKNIFRMQAHLINSLVGHKIPLPLEYRVAASILTLVTLNFFSFRIIEGCFLGFVCLWDSVIEIMYIGRIFKIYSAWHSTWGTVTLWLWNFFSLLLC